MQWLLQSQEHSYCEVAFISKEKMAIIIHCEEQHYCVACTIGLIFFCYANNAVKSDRYFPAKIECLIRGMGMYLVLYMQITFIVRSLLAATIRNREKQS